MMDATRIIQASILDAEVDPRIETGIFDVTNSEHLRIFKEHLNRNLALVGVNPEESGEFGELDEDGKHPDRQAYNKDGWLVTFPSKEYKDKAIKKGTHYSSDPTHGKGGMNLYYKKKGKQQRQKQQDVSSTGPSQQDQPEDTKPQTTKSPESDQSNQSIAKPQSVIPTDSGEDKSSDSSPSTGQSVSQGLPQSTDAKSAQTTDNQGGENSDLPSSDTSSSKNTDDKQSEPQTNSTQNSHPRPSVVAPKTSITIDFAKSKGWSPTPYGEWRNETGEVMAVVSLSGEVVPLKSVIRDELKLFASRKVNA